MPPEEHDDASRDDVEPRSLLLDNLAEASSSPLAPKLHLDNISQVLNSLLKLESEAKLYDDLVVGVLV